MQSLQMSAGIGAAFGGIPDDWLPLIASRPIDVKALKKRKANEIDANKFHEDLRRATEQSQKGNDG